MPSPPGSILRASKPWVAALPITINEESDADPDAAHQTSVVSDGLCYDLERVPHHLREIFVYARAWGIRDASERRQRISSASEGELKQFVDAVAPYLDDILSWQRREVDPLPELDLFVRLAHTYHEIEKTIAS